MCVKWGTPFLLACLNKLWELQIQDMLRGIESLSKYAATAVDGTVFEKVNKLYQSVIYKWSPIDAPVAKLGVIPIHVRVSMTCMYE